MPKPEPLDLTDQFKADVRRSILLALVNRQGVPGVAVMSMPGFTPREQLPVTSEGWATEIARCATILSNMVLGVEDHQQDKREAPQ